MSTQTIINKKSQFYVRGGYIIVNTVLKINTFIQAVRFYYDQGH